MSVSDLNLALTELLDDYVFKRVLREEAKANIACSSWPATCETEEIIELERLFIGDAVVLSQDAFNQCSKAVNEGLYKLMKQILVARTTLDGISRYLYEEQDIGGI